MLVYSVSKQLADKLRRRQFTLSCELIDPIGEARGETDREMSILRNSFRGVLD